MAKGGILAYLDGILLGVLIQSFIAGGGVNGRYSEVGAQAVREANSNNTQNEFVIICIITGGSRKRFWIGIDRDSTGACFQLS